jgi:hypothetical protein
MNILDNYSDDELKAAYPKCYAARIAKRGLTKDRIESAKGRSERREARKLKAAAEEQRQVTCGELLRDLNALRPIQTIQSRERSLLASVLCVKVTGGNLEAMSKELSDVLDELQKRLNKQQAILDGLQGVSYVTNG